MLGISIIKRASSFQLLRPLHSLVTKPVSMVRGTDPIQLEGKRSYEDAVLALNSLQTNAAVLEQMRKERGGRMQRDSLPAMARFLERISIEVPDLNKLNVIHVSGSKGKGSVCSMSESILRQCGLKTGFYSSPHLLEVRERIRINGKPLSKDKFAEYFWICWDRLEDTLLESDGEMPAYFRFLTLLSFLVFLEEKVDAAVMEVGVGGQYDCTNIIREPVVCGITQLELEHTSVLGDTIEKIAWHKAGIMKYNRPAVTIPQKAAAMEVLKTKAEELKAGLRIAPALGKYSTDELALGLEGEHQRINASLALQLCWIWMQEKGSCGLIHGVTSIAESSNNEVSREEDRGQTVPESPLFTIPKQFAAGLASVSWPGRNQVVSRKKCTFYLDGAHTSGSLAACARWYDSRKDIDVRLPRNEVFRVLMFNSTGERDCKALLQELTSLDFDHAVFCPNVVNGGLNNADQANFTVTRDKQLTWCEANMHTWLELRNQIDAAHHAIDPNSHHLAGTALTSTEQSTVFSCISDSVSWILGGREPLVDKPPRWCPDTPQRLATAEHVQVLVTGSLHLVGGVMKFLGPEMVEVV